MRPVTSLARPDADGSGSLLTHRLKVVRPRAEDPRSPEDMLGYLFARERQLQAELAQVRRDLDVQRVRYSKAHNLRVFAGLDTLRQQFGPEKHR